MDLERVRDIKSIEILIDLLRARVGSSTSYTALAKNFHVSIQGKFTLVTLVNNVPNPKKLVHKGNRCIDLNRIRIRKPIPIVL